MTPTERRDDGGATPSRISRALAGAVVAELQRIRKGAADGLAVERVEQTKNGDRIASPVAVMARVR